MITEFLCVIYINTYFWSLKGITIGIVWLVSKLTEI